jgi:NAD(P)-dependent dehydrogenase (short-subunit alcohol dehydrogenase family)
MDLDIKGLRVLVTAGASGIGLATARAFAAKVPRSTSATSMSPRHAVATGDIDLQQMVCDVATRQRWRGCSIRQRARSAASMR